MPGFHEFSYYSAVVKKTLARGLYIGEVIFVLLSLLFSKRYLHQGVQIVADLSTNVWIIL